MKRFIPLKDTPKTKVIFETDLCEDVDDVGALAILLDLVRRKKLNLAGISINVNAPGEAAAADVLLARFGLSSLPVCVWDGEELLQGEDSPYISFLSKQARREVPKPQSPVDFYRDILSDAEDGGVTIISVGFFCNLDAAYRAMPQLFEQKVRRVIVMAGDFTREPPHAEYNVRKMADSAQRFLNGFSGEILYLPFEAGDRVITDLRDWPAGCGDPIYEAYRIHTKEKRTRPSWDPLTVDFAYWGENEYYLLSPWGRVTVQADSTTLFREEAGGNHAVVQLKRSFEETGAYISNVIRRCCEEEEERK